MIFFPVKFVKEHFFPVKMRTYSEKPIPFKIEGNDNEYVDVHIYEKDAEFTLCHAAKSNKSINVLQIAIFPITYLQPIS